ncbi:hypothetical protein GYMLUDRAFT_54855 [Collybiopsis luxurians FD-317 M1]|nr:hypothetical protein GYMLUDRAFT_54855 [Collybiopsis luxurians FD-317 M1]
MDQSKVPSHTKNIGIPEASCQQASNPAQVSLDLTPKEAPRVLQCAASVPPELPSQASSTSQSRKEHRANNLERTPKQIHDRHGNDREGDVIMTDHQVIHPYDARKTQVRLSIPTPDKMTGGDNENSHAKEDGRAGSHARETPRRIASRSGTQEGPEQGTWSRRKSELSNEVDKTEVLDKLMKASVTLPIKDVLGSSEELCCTFSDKI